MAAETQEVKKINNNGKQLYIKGTHDGAQLAIAGELDPIHTSRSATLSPECREAKSTIVPVRSKCTARIAQGIARPTNKMTTASDPLVINRPKRYHLELRNSSMSDSVGMD